MEDFFLFKSGTIRKKNGSVVLENDDGDTLIPIEQIRTLSIFGEVTINKRILELLSKYQVTLLLFNYYGDLVGSFNPENHRPVGKVLNSQVMAIQNPELRNQIAKSIQTYSLKNSLSVLKYYHKKGIPLMDQIVNIEKLIEELQQTLSVEEVTLIEARAKKEYYSGFDLILKDLPFRFVKRTTMPPENEVNSLMSFGYYLLYSSILAQLNISKLYPELPFIHSDLRSGYGLQYDLADIYKPILVDRLFLGMIRRHSFHKNDFEKRENGGIYLTDEGKKKFVAEFNEELGRKVPYGKRVRSYRSVIRHDIHKLIEYLNDPKGDLTFYWLSW